MSCRVVQVNPITMEETVLGEYYTRQACADALGISYNAVTEDIVNGRMTRYGCYIREDHDEADE